MNEEHIRKMELRWGAVVAGAVSLIVAIIAVSSFVMAMHPPSHVETIDPTTLSKNKEFAESNLGTSVNPDGSVTVRIIANSVRVCAALHSGAAGQAGDFPRYKSRCHSRLSDYRHKREYHGCARVCF